jgi:hypothetical protein
MTRSRLAGAVADKGLELERDQVPPLMPIASHTWPADAEPTPMAALPQDAPAPIMAALAAAWLLMQQPQLVERQPVEATRDVRQAYHRAGRPAPEVTLVDLRRQYVPDQADADDTGPSSRHRHRWVVSGHWRNQAYGPDRSLRRPTWIAAYVKGPDGAPLLTTERVNVWRR